MKIAGTIIGLAWAATALAQSAAPHEKAAIEALAKEPAASAFPIEVYPVSAPMPDHPGIAGIFVTIPGGGLSPAIKAKTARISTISFNPLIGARVSPGERAGGSGKSITNYRGRGRARNLTKRLL